MKIYREIKELCDFYYFMTSKENGLFCFSLALPDRNTLILCECSTGRDDEIYDKATVVSDNIYKQFNKLYNKKGNYQGICSLLKEVFEDVDQDDLNKAFDRDDVVFDLTDRCIKEYGKEVYDLYYWGLYQDVKGLIKLWNGDEERIIKWVTSEVIPDKTAFHLAMVDVRGVENPTKNRLLHRFYSY